MYHLGFLLFMISAVQAQNGPCFEFLGDAFLQYRPNNFNNSHIAHYHLMLRTKAEEGVVMYSEGRDDYEALFLSQGKLVYLLTNPSPSGLGGSSGGLYVSNQKVNNGTWLEVDVWRNWEMPRKYRRAGGNYNNNNKWQMRTGLGVVDTFSGLRETHVDNILHGGVVLNNTVYFGGVISTALHTQNTASADFVGRIQHLYEERNHVDFDNSYTLNTHGRVTLCS